MTQQMNSIFDECYEGYNDILGTLELHRRKDGTWYDWCARALFWQEKRRDWRFREGDGDVFGGYKTLEKAVQAYHLITLSEHAELNESILKRKITKAHPAGWEYHCDPLKGTLTSKYTLRCLFGELDAARFERLCKAFGAELADFLRGKYVPKQGNTGVQT